MSHFNIVQLQPVARHAQTFFISIKSELSFKFLFICLQLQLLQLLPSLASQSIMVPLILQTLSPMLHKNSKPYVVYLVHLMVLFLILYSCTISLHIILPLILETQQLHTELCMFKNISPRVFSDDPRMIYLGLKW